MMVKITLALKNGLNVSFDTDIDFSVTELPYLCQAGFRQNGSSQASPEDLHKYWNLIEDFLNSQNIPITQYETLQSIGEA